MNPAAVDVPCRLLLSSKQAELVVGQREEVVRRIRAESGANVQVLDKGLPAAFHARDECLAVIKTDGAAQLRRALSLTLQRAFGAAGAEPADERPRTVEVMIPEVACRHLVGSRGDRIKLLREEAGCDVQLAPGGVAGVSAQRRVRCGGRLAALVEAVARVHEVLVEFAAIGILNPRQFDLQQGSQASAGPAGASSKNSRLAVRMLVSKDECAWLIGKRGNKINKLRDLAMVSTRDADPGMCGEGAECVVEVFGAPLAKELCVLQLIVDDLALMREASAWTRLLLPAELATTVESSFGDISTHSGVASLGLARRGAWAILELCGGERERLAAACAVHEALEPETALSRSAARAEQAPATGSGIPHREVEPGVLAGRPPSTGLGDAGAQVAEAAERALPDVRALAAAGQGQRPPEAAPSPGLDAAGAPVAEAAERALPDLRALAAAGQGQRPQEAYATTAAPSPAAAGATAAGATRVGPESGRSPGAAAAAQPPATREGPAAPTAPGPGSGFGRGWHAAAAAAVAPGAGPGPGPWCPPGRPRASRCACSCLAAARRRAWPARARASRAARASRCRPSGCRSELLARSPTITGHTPGRRDAAGECAGLCAGATGALAR
ncbi:unnamed protein product [Prorocentrum cordatum]|uniref:K Homology domain-containing protein n=1 Tax=Prorocentrum cordatum TaxID=2364126 RepID=A0ABN9W8T0_9DINO|nr:unnamed protein product [Polarella glacialis]